MGGTAEGLRVFPSDGSRISLPFNEQYSVKLNDASDQEIKDVFALRIDLDDFAVAGDSPLIAQDLDQGLLYAENLKRGDELWIVGYPAESNFVDYERETIRSTRAVIRALYDGESISDHCHTLCIETSIELNSLDGLSGSPVFYMKRVLEEGEFVEYPLLVGMLLRGTASSGIAHFVTARVLTEVVRIAERPVS